MNTEISIVRLIFTFFKAYVPLHLEVKQNKVLNNYNGGWKDGEVMNSLSSVRLPYPTQPSFHYSSYQKPPPLRSFHEVNI